MRYYVSILLISYIILGCQPTIKNNPETLEKIFHMSNFDIEIKHSSCFGSNEELFKVSKINNGFYIKSKRTKKQKFISNQKMDSLKYNVASRIEKERYGGCTVREYVRIGTYFNSIDYTNSSCSELIDDFLNYND